MTAPMDPHSISAAMPRGVPSVSSPTSRPLVAPRENWPSPISADALPASVERGRAAGFADYLTKPVEMEALHAVLQGLVTRQPA